MRDLADGDGATRCRGRLDAAGADLVTAPLLPDERIAAVLLDRYDAAIASARREAEVRGPHRVDTLDFWPGPEDV